MTPFTRLLRRFSQLLADPLVRFQLSLLALLMLTATGTLVYMLLEGWTPIESLYMTIITIATVGFGEVRELSSSGRLFTIVLIIAGVGLATTAVSNALSLALGPLLWDTLRSRRMMRMVETLDNHFIVCGYGRMGRQISKDLMARNEPFVLIDADADKHEALLEKNIAHIIGDATRDETLLLAGIERARGIVVALNDDATNVLTVLSARELNPKIFIVARSTNEESDSKMLRAGANRVNNPYLIGGHRMALTLLRPAVNDFLDQIYHFGEGEDIDIGQVSIHEGSRLAGQTVASCDLRRTHKVNILAIRTSGQRLSISPAPDTPLNVGDDLIVIGSPESIYEIERQTLLKSY